MRTAAMSLMCFNSGATGAPHADCALQKGDRTAYYAQRNFPADFLEFVKLEYLPMSNAPLAIGALAAYEAATLAGKRASEIDFDRVQNPDDRDAPLSPDSRPQLLPGVNVIELAADYQEIVSRLRERKPLDRIPWQPVKLVTCRLAADRAVAWQLSPLSAELLDLCEGNLTLREITAEFEESRLGIPGVPAAQACLAGIEILRQQRLIALS